MSEDDNVAATPVLDALLHLDSYAKSHAVASNHLKASIWNLTKARRSKGGYHMSASADPICYVASEVREELRASVHLHVEEKEEEHARKEEEEEEEKTPALVDEGESTTGNDLFQLRNAQTLKTKKGTETATETADGFGLRQRKGASLETKEDEGWQNLTVDSDAEWLQQEEERLREANPLDLFGALPPPALKESQAKARAALAAYVEAANRVAQIMKLTNQLAAATAEGAKGTTDKLEEKEK